MTSQTARATTPQSPDLLREMLGNVAVLTLNRPEARNSLSEGLIAELHAALKDIHDDTKVRAVVIAASGPAFSAGHDMKELTARRADADRGRGYFAEIMTACGWRARSLRRDQARRQRDDAALGAVAQAGGGAGPGRRCRRRVPAGGEL